MSSAPYGLLYSWWRSDSLPPIDGPAGLNIRRSSAEELASCAGMSKAELAQRAREGHEAWIAIVGSEPVGWGWTATREAHIGGLEITLSLPSVDRYLWDFVTLPTWRGRRIYPALIQAMIRADGAAERFWIGHDFSNQASRRGILRAGMTDVGAVHPAADGGLIYHPRGPIARASAGAALLGLPLVDPASYPSASDEQPS